MPIVNHIKKTITFKIVYWGPGLSGKTTNIKYLSGGSKKFIQLASQEDRTVFFDFFPTRLEKKVQGYKIILNLYSVPGQILYAASRRIMLNNADGIIVVFDAQRDMIEQNVGSIEDLRLALVERGLNYKNIPIIFQYNKLDLPNTESVSKLNSSLNPDNRSYMAAIANEGRGVKKTLLMLIKLLLANFDVKDYKK